MAQYCALRACLWTILSLRATVRKDANGAFLIEDEVPTNNLDVSQRFFDLVREGKTNTLDNFWIGAKYLQNSLYQLLGRQN